MGANDLMVIALCTKLSEEIVRKLILSRPMTASV